MSRGTSVDHLCPRHCAIGAIAGTLANEIDHSRAAPPADLYAKARTRPKATFIGRQRNRGNMQATGKSRIVDRVTELPAEHPCRNELIGVRRAISENQRSGQLRTAEG